MCSPCLHGWIKLMTAVRALTLLSLTCLSTCCYLISRETVQELLDLIAEQALPLTARPAHAVLPAGRPVTPGPSVLEGSRDPLQDLQGFGLALAAQRSLYEAWFPAGRNGRLASASVQRRLIGTLGHGLMGGGKNMNYNKERKQSMCGGVDVISNHPRVVCV